MAAQDLFPGQAERVEFDLEQTECLTSVARSEVFWTFSADEPMSIAEVAAGVGKSANATTYHVNELVRVGLLLPVEERKRRSRTEKLYVRSARRFFTKGAHASPEYREKAVQTFFAFTRNMAREYAALNETYEVDTGLSAFSAYRRFNARVSAERAVEFKERIAALIREFSLEPPDPEGVRVHFSFYMSPTLEESRKVMRKSSRKKPKDG